MIIFRYKVPIELLDTLTVETVGGDSSDETKSQFVFTPYQKQKYTCIYLV